MGDGPSDSGRSTDPRDFFSARDNRAEARTVAAIEEKVVKAVLKRFGLLGRLADLKRKCEAATGSPDISLAWFQLTYQSFPVWLGAANVPWVRDMWGELRDRFTKTTLFKAWEGVSELMSDTDDRPFGLVFTWPQFAECIIHNNWRGGDIGFEKVPGLRIVTTLKSLGEPIVIEPLSQFLQHLEWPEGENVV